MPNISSKNKSLALPSIERHIYIIRGQKVMLDSDLAALYGVKTKALNQAVRRNITRFPEDFMFRLTDKEAASMRSQIVTASKRNIQYQSLAFTEQGVAMLSSVLKSRRAIEMNILIIRAFVHLREMIATHKDLAVRVEKLEARQNKTVSILGVLVDEIGGIKHETRRMKTLPEPAKRKIGFEI